MTDIRELQDICDTPIEEITYHKTRAVMAVFFKEYNAAEAELAECSLDDEYDLKRRFYNRWKPFADVCKALKALEYSENWEVRCAIKDADRVLWVFPFGWKH